MIGRNEVEIYKKNICKDATPVANVIKLFTAVS
jgi:hypothetical protein